MSKSQADWDYFFLEFAEQVAQQSYDKKTKVGTVITRGDSILAYSYNGTPPGWDNTMRDSEGKTLPWVVHSEAAALAKLCRSTETSLGATLYCTLSPCIECAKLCVTAGISRIVYRDSYKSSAGIEMFKEAEIETVQYDGLGLYPKYHCTGFNHNKHVNPAWVSNMTGL